MSGDGIQLDAFDAPFGKQVRLTAIEESGTGLLRVRIREKSRFTILDLDPVTAERWGKAMVEWAKSSA